MPKLKHTISLDAYAYRLTKTKRPGSDLGACECCGEEGREFYQLVQLRRYVSRATGEEGLTELGCFRLFGHRHCLVKHAV